MATTFLSDPIRPDTDGLLLIDAVAISVGNITGLNTENLQAALLDLVTQMPDSAADIALTPIANLDATDAQAGFAEIQAELTALQTGIQGLTPQQERILQQTSEVGTTTYSLTPSGTVSAASGGVPAGGFSNPLTGFIVTAGDFFIEIPAATATTDLFVRVYDDVGAFISGEEIDVDASSLAVSGAPVGFQRYQLLTTLNVANGGFEVRLETRAQTFTRYDLSSLVRLAASQITGTISESQLDPALLSLLNAGGVGALSLDQKLFFAEVAVDSTTPVNQISSIDVKIGAPSNDVNDYTAAPGLFEDGTSYTVIVPITQRIIHFETSEGNIFTVTDLGQIIDGFRGYNVDTPSLIPQGFSIPFGGTVTTNTVTFTNKVKIGEDNLEANILERLAMIGRSQFTNHVRIVGTPAATAITNFYTRPLSELPQTDISNWVEISNGNVPQAEGGDVEFVLLLPEGTYPNTLTWVDINETPPAAVTEGEFNEVAGNAIPSGFQGFAYTRPNFTADQATQFGTLTGGAIADADVRQINFDATVQVRDENLRDVTLPSDVLSDADRQKLNLLQVRTITNTENVVQPGLPAEVIFTSLWPDPQATYPEIGDPVGDRSEITGLSRNPIRIRNVRGAASINTSNTQPPFNTIFNNLRRISRNRNIDPEVTGPGVLTGVMDITDEDGTNFLMDERGIVIIGSILASGQERTQGPNQDIFQFGDPAINNTRMQFGVYSPIPGQELFGVRTFRGNSAEHTVTETRRIDLQDGVSGSREHHFGIDVGETSTGDVFFVVPATFTQTLTPVITVKTYNNHNFEASDDFTLQQIADLGSSGSQETHLFPGGGFSHDFTFQYFAANAPETSGTNFSGVRVIRVSPTTPLTLPTIDYVMSISAPHTVDIVVPAGSQVEASIDIPANLTLGGGFDETTGRFSPIVPLRYDCAVHMHLGSHGQMTYNVAINGDVAGTPIETNELPASGAQPIRLGNDGGTLSFTRIMVLRPNDANSISDELLGTLSQRGPRNRLYGDILQLPGQAAELITGESQVIQLQSLDTTAFRGRNPSSYTPEMGVVSGSPRDFTITNGQIVADADFNAMVALSVEFDFQSSNLRTAGLASRELTIFVEWLEDGQQMGTPSFERSYDPVNDFPSLNDFFGDTLNLVRGISFKKGSVYRPRIRVSTTPLLSWNTGTFTIGAIPLGNVNISLVTEPSVAQTE